MRRRSKWNEPQGMVRTASSADCIPMLNMNLPPNVDSSITGRGPLRANSIILFTLEYFRQ